MKIVILEKEEGFGIGGIGVYNQRLRSFLEKRGHEVNIISFSNKKTKDKNILNISYHWGEKRGFIVVPSEHALTKMRKYLKRIKPDLVHFSIGISPLDLMVPSLCHKLKIPVLGIWHSDFNTGNNAYSLLAKSMYTAYLPVCGQLDSLVVFSEKLKNFHIKHGLDESKIFIIPNGTNTNFYKPGVSLFGKTNQIKRGILFLGRVTIQKNPEVLLNAFSSLSSFADTKLIIVGDGDQKEGLQEEYQDSRIIFTGMIKSEKQKLDIIRSCQIFVLPSYIEGMSLALVEAMSCGLACVTSDAGSHDELLENAGITIPISRLKQELPLALRLLLSNPDVTQLLGKKARIKAQKYYSQGTNFGQLIKTYQQTIFDYKKRGYPQTNPINLNYEIKERLKRIWEKAKELGTTYLLGDE